MTNSRLPNLPISTDWRASTFTRVVQLRSDTLSMPARIPWRNEKPANRSGYRRRRRALHRAIAQTESAIVVEVVDASYAMLRRLMQRAGLNAGRVHPHFADARQLHLASSGFDLVATHFFLDCLTTIEVESLAIRLRRSMTRDALWVFDFAIPDNWYGRLIAKPLVTALYLAFRFMTGLTIRKLPWHRDALQRADSS